VTDPFGTRLHSAMRLRGPLCVGIDPHPHLLAAWDLPDNPAGLERFALSCVDALADRVAVLKPQSAFFERYGAAGVTVLERTVGAARSAGALVLLDVKRGDIGSTMQAYADAYLDPRSPLAGDAITVSPYLGFGSLQPAIDTALAAGAGVFVLALTSNPEGEAVQQARTSGGTVAADVLSAVREVNEGAAPLGSIGAVVAANLAAGVPDLAVNGPLLAPGYGAQGGTGERLRHRFSAVAETVLPSASRSVLSAGPDKSRLQAAARRTLDDIRAAFAALD
jgi:orotidine-5'-phosphate decarboxylase